LLDRPQQQHTAGGADRQRITRAREAAEALFAPKRPVAKTLEAVDSRPANPTAQKSRVLSVTPPPVASGEKTEPITRSEPQTLAPGMPASLVARIRSWVKYGMTARQVAEVTGIAAGEIERVLRKG
jgi:hypothetical protein